MSSLPLLLYDLTDGIFKSTFEVKTVPETLKINCWVFPSFLHYNMFREIHITNQNSYSIHT